MDKLKELDLAIQIDRAFEYVDEYLDEKKLRVLLIISILLFLWCTLLGAVVMVLYG